MNKIWKKVKRYLSREMTDKEFAVFMGFAVVAALVYWGTRSRF